MTAQVPAKPGERPGYFLAPIQREFDRLFDQLGAGLAPWAAAQPKTIPIDAQAN